MQTTEGVIADLTAEGQDLDRLLSGLDEEQWSLATPAPGWTVTEQVGHLAFVFRIAGLAAADPDAFTAMTAKIGGGFDAAVNAALAEYVADPPAVLLARWRTERDNAIKALAAVPADQTVPWLVNPLPPAVLCAAGMMELFAHGQDIADAVGVRRERHDRLARIVEFVVLTRDFGYPSRGLTPPAEPFRFEIVAPSGELLEFGPADAADRVSGSAEDLCLLATRRRHASDLRLQAVGAQAQQWLEIAQAYRGPAGQGRVAGQFPASS